MTKKIVDGKVKAVCNYCKSKLAGSSNAGTRHLSAHVENCIRKTQTSNPGALQKLLATKKIDGKTVIANYNFDQGVCRKDLVNMIVLHEHPLSIVDQVGFKVFCNSLQSLFKVPTRNTVRADVFELYKTEMKKTKELLEKNEGRVAITTDMWTADHQKKSYMAVTAHFVDQSWGLQQRLLRFQNIPSPHTTEVLGDYLMKVLYDWNLDLKLSTITMGNCSVNDGLVEILVQKIGSEELLLGGEVLHMRCCAHILNLIVKDGLDVIGTILENIRASCVYWSSTPKKIEKFEEATRQLPITCNKKLSYDVKTRWNSTYTMLETTLAYKEVFPRLKKRDAQYKTLPSVTDWEKAKIISEKLKNLL
ncbi:Zinc finger BED domain-containing protein DAYSLEEPER [Rhynchospora pubera]|uniref:Zinc finger BED domain-containing protein DAYSLEEPER n=1 Tax=Rhynchospora pubera TaxID=906938 RepID=A0AAV8H9R8_9POAL|nr:Zinc finger BED domain-containing protein DAYSLEEPER [Rhynchospora pubera]